MSLVKCPECQKTISDVASACPHCRAITAIASWKRHDSGLTMLCHRCGVRIPRRSPVCCNCGVQGPRARRSYFRSGVIGLVAASALVILTSSLWLRDRSAEAENLPLTPVVAANAFAAPPAPPADPQEDGVTGNPATPSVPQTEELVTPGPAVAADHVETVKLWTRTWANVRRERGTESEIVTILQPGVSIDVGDRESHWWAVIEEGVRVGYVANSVLTADPAEVLRAPALVSQRT